MARTPPADLLTAGRLEIDRRCAGGFCQSLGLGRACKQKVQSTVSDVTEERFQSGR